MTDTISKPRVLLRRLHGVMASTAEPQEKLDRVVRVIAQNMVAEVCSIYLVRAGGVLELFATEGLSAAAVHQTRLTQGEGLVGLVAERMLPLNLSEAPDHPRFSFRPETGEEMYHSFLGVPIVKGGRAVGVLTVQNVTQRIYSPEEVEVLQTIAMVAAETVAADQMIDREELYEDATALGEPITLDGMGFANGVGAGAAVLLRPQVTIGRTIADDVEAELQKLDTAICSVQAQFDDLIAHPELTSTGAHREVLESYRMFAEDPSWQKRMRDVIETGLTAEAAAQRVQFESRARMRKIRDPYIRERLNDLQQLTDRLIRTIQGKSTDERAELTEPSILVARNLGAAELLEYRGDNLRGVAIEEGSSTAHITVVARAMGIPVLGQVAGLLEHVEAGEPLILDTGSRKLFVRPAEDVIEAYRSTLAQRAQLQAEFEAEKELPAETRDGQTLDLMLNAGLLVDLPQLDRTGADGIGLFRTEFQFMIAPTLPKVDEQRKIYAAALDAAGDDRQVVFRTLDIGGDKQVPFLPKRQEENPAMGWRAIRIGIDRPALLRYQLRALLQAAGGRTLNVMFPMIAEVAELKKCKTMLDKEIERLGASGGVLPLEVRVGCMIEVPSLVWQMDALVREVDFLSVGTNDLMQFFFACDRGNPNLSGRYDLLSAPALQLLDRIVQSGRDAGIPVTVCGEMGGRPLEAMGLIGLGLRRLSVAANAIGPIKRVIRQIDSQALENFLRARMDSSRRSIRDELINFARDQGIKY